jgi:hypothetical protein
MIWSLFCIGVFVALLLSNADTAQGFSILSRSAYHNALQLYSTVRVALTREREENAKLADALRDIPDCDLLHLPCLTFQERDDVSKLKEAIVKASTEEGFVLTSPQASKVFLRLWRESGRPAVRVATVGEGTSTALRAEGLSPYFEPSEALGEALAAELPTDFAARVFFACSALAADAVPDGLRRRGFQVRSRFVDAGALCLLSSWTRSVRADRRVFDGARHVAGGRRCRCSCRARGDDRQPVGGGRLDGASSRRQPQ